MKKQSNSTQGKKRVKAERASMELKKKKEQASKREKDNRQEFPIHEALSNSAYCYELREQERKKHHINLQQYAAKKTWTPYQIASFLQYVYADSGLQITSEHEFLDNILLMLDFLESRLPETVKQSRPQIHNRKTEFSISIRKEGKDFYPRHTDPQFDDYIVRWCILRMRQQISRCRKQLQLHPETYSRIDLFNRFDYFEQVFQGKQPMVFRSRAALTNLWRTSVYTPNQYPIGTAYETKAGERVRSKNECMVADLLYELGIPYLYEFPVVKRDGTVVYPDFCILSPVTFKIYYLEVLGLMQNPEYVKHNLVKIDEYARENISLGDQLLVIFDGEATPFNRKTVKRLLEDTVLRVGA